MFQTRQQENGQGRDVHVEFERHALQVAIELARAEGFEGIEAAFVEMLEALEQSTNFRDF